MIPDLLKPYEAALKKYQRNYIKINAIPRDEIPLEDKLPITQSKFLGLPFFPKEKSYPKDKNGQAMIMVAQLNFEEIPPLANFPKDGLLQLFLSSTHWDSNDSEVIYHSKEALNLEPITDFSFLTSDNFKDIPVDKIHELVFEASIENGNVTDKDFDFVFWEDDFYDFYETLTDEQATDLDNYLRGDGHKIGGYAYFTQDDPRQYDKSKKEDVQILQIDTDNEIRFGDNGVGHIFIKEQDLINKDFSQAYFYWDCY